MTNQRNIEKQEDRVDKIITFKNGFLGLENYKKYILLDHPGTDIIKWFQSVENSDIALPVINPVYFFPDYAPKISKTDLETIEIKSPEEALILCIITVPDDPKKITVNLKAPIVINFNKLLADQFVAENDEYKVRQPLQLSKPQRRCKGC